MNWQDHISVFGGVGIALAAVMLVLLLPVLPRGERRRVRVPFLLLVLHIGVIGVRVVLRQGEHLDGELDEPLWLLELFLLLASMARSGYLLVLHAIVRRTLGGDVPRILRDVIQVVLYAGVVVVTLRAAGVEMASLFATSALLTAVVGFALQDTLGNLFAGLAIQAQRPFTVGDWIQFDEERFHIGRVVEINWRAVRVQTLDRFEMFVPNATLAKSALRNFSSPSRITRRRAHIEAPFDAPPERVIADLLHAIEHLPGVLAEPQPDAIVTEFNERGVRYELRYFINDFAARESIDGQVRERIWYAFQRHAVPIGVPQRLVRMYDLTAERLQQEEQAKVEARHKAMRNVSFLQVLPDEAQLRLASLAQVRMYAPGELIIETGDAGSELFIVRRGQVAVQVRNGKRVKEVATLAGGDFFGEMSLMTGEARRADVRATHETEVLVVGKEALQPLLEESPELAESISQALVERQQELSDKSRLTEPSLEVERETVDLLDRIKAFFSLTQRKDS